jgi:hypothetical protein
MRRLNKEIPVIIEMTKTGYSAYSENPDVFTTGEDIPSLYSNLLEALNLACKDSGYTVTADNLSLRLDLRQFFQYYKVLNANFLAERIGMNPSLLSQYVRGKKQPSSKQTARIIRGIQNIGKELAEIKFV